MSERTKKDYVSIDELAASWAVSPIMVRRLVWAKKLPATRFGRVIRISIAQAAEYAALHTVERSPK